MKILLENHKQILQSVNDVISVTKNNGSINDELRAERLKTKAEVCRIFITDIEKAIKRVDEAEKSDKYKTKIVESLELAEATMDAIGREMVEIISEKMVRTIGGEKGLINREPDAVLELDKAYNEARAKRAILRHILDE